MKNWGRKAHEFKPTNPAENVRFESGMTSEQKYHSIAESVLSSFKETEVVKGCPMHPKLSKKCRKCQQVEKNALLQLQIKEDNFKLDESFPEAINWNTSLFKSHFNEKLQRNIEECNAYKFNIKPINTIKDLSNTITPEQISIDTYRPGSSDNPTDFICYFYRLAELHPTREQITIMLKANNVNVRCLILLYLRVYADPYMVYGCINHSFKDNKLLSVMTIGQYAIRLFDQSQLNHGGFRIPRLPIKIQKKIDQKIAQFQLKKERQFQRERSRSRERKKRLFGQQRAKQQAHKGGQSSSSSSSSSASEDQRQQAIKEEPQKKVETQTLTLKQRIRLLQQKNRANERRNAILEGYKAEKVQKLESDQEQYNENDEIEKYKMG